LDIKAPDLPRPRVLCLLHAGRYIPNLAISAACACLGLRQFTFLCLDLLKASSGMAYARLEVVPARLKSTTWLSEPEFNGAQVAPAYCGVCWQLAMSAFVRKTVRSLHDFRAFHIPAEPPN
jgi:hypothetical protein